MIGLQNYWPIVSNTNDIVGGAHMYGPVNAALTNDRFNNPNSAIHLNVGYYRLPSGVYFSGDFTVTVWAYIIGITRWFRVLETGINTSGTITDILCFYYTYDLTLNPGFIIWPSTNYLKSTTTLNLNQWNNVAFTLKGSTASVYVNGVLADQKIHTTPLNVIRNSNFVGGSNWPVDPLPNVIYDELRIFNRALDASEIVEIMNL